MIEDQIKNYFTKNADIVAVYLYGSYASGKVHPGSDVDIAILFDNRDRFIVNQRLEKFHIELSRILRKDLHLTPLDFAGEVLLKQILKKGRCLTVNDSKKLAYFKMNALTRIADFQYHLNKMQSAMTRRVMKGL
jgi:predicted nucleotidyltransferase